MGEGGGKSGREWEKCNRNVAEVQLITWGRCMMIAESHAHFKCNTMQRVRVTVWQLNDGVLHNEMSCGWYVR